MCGGVTATAFISNYLGNIIHPKRCSTLAASLFLCLQKAACALCACVRYVRTQTK